MFGPDFKDYVQKEIKLKEVESSIQAFIEIGRDRNLQVHQDFGSFTLEKTSQEIYALYTKAIEFVTWFPGAIRCMIHRHRFHY